MNSAIIAHFLCFTTDTPLGHILHSVPRHIIRHIFSHTFRPVLGHTAGTQPWAHASFASSCRSETDFGTQYPPEGCVSVVKSFLCTMNKIKKSFFVLWPTLAQHYKFCKEMCHSPRRMPNWYKDVEKQLWVYGSCTFFERRVVGDIGYGVTDSLKFCLIWKSVIYNGIKSSEYQQQYRLLQCYK